MPTTAFGYCAFKCGTWLQFGDLTEHAKVCPGLNATKAKFTVLGVAADVIIIRDDGGKVSVTNDAEAVVRKVVREHGNKRIHYYDSMGNLDELVHKDGEFKSFRVIQTKGRVTK